VSGPRVVIADDHPPIRAAVSRILSEEGFDVCGEAGDAASALSAVREARPDVCLLDVHMPGSGIAAASAVARELPETAVVMLTISEEDEDLFDALSAGASGYLLKGDDPHTLGVNLRRILEGDAVLPPRLLARVLHEFRGRRGRRAVIGAHGARAALTDREWTVLELLREGFSTTEIAARLFISGATVRSHVSAILAKLDVPDRASAIGLLEPPLQRTDTTNGQ
jgi:DNA-binding NarL/FixJ family response regulator